MSTPNIRGNMFQNQRRSQRILLSVPLLVSGKNTGQAAFSERTSTLVVNAHGGLLLLKEVVRLGQSLKLKNLATQEEITCTVVDLNASPNTLTEVGVEFVPPCPKFWRVSFPPTDWSSRNPEAKRYTSAPAPLDTTVKK